MKKTTNLKIIYAVLFLALSLQTIFCKSTQDKTADEKITISIAPPYMKNSSVNTIFFNRQFVFEFLSLYESDNQTEILPYKNYTSERDYKLQCIEDAKNSDSDYLVYSSVYGHDNNVYLKTNIINIWTNEVLLYKFYNTKIEYAADEVLTESISEIIRDINNLHLTKTVRKVTKKVKEKDPYADSKQAPNYKHELFVQSGFFKNHPIVMSFFNLYSGYNFTPFDIFNIEAALFFGTGYYEKEFNFDYNLFSDFFVGTSAAFRFFIKGPIEPNVGLRVEFSYVIVKNVLLVSLPIDAGIKIYIDNENLIKINTSFQFNYFDIFLGRWVNSWTLGVMVGYARKL